MPLKPDMAIHVAIGRDGRERYRHHAGLGGGKKRVRRDDGKIFDSIAAASMSAYGYAGSGIKRAITTGRKAKGHHWYWADEISEDSQR